MNINQLMRDTNLSIAIELGLDASIRSEDSPILVVFNGIGLTPTVLPHWSGQINLALNLPIPKDAQWNLIWHCHTRRDVASLVWHDSPDDPVGHWFESRRPWGELALAICLAWLEYRKWLTDQKK